MLPRGLQRGVTGDTPDFRMRYSINRQAGSRPLSYMGKLKRFSNRSEGHLTVPYREPVKPARTLCLQVPPDARGCPSRF